MAFLTGSKVRAAELLHAVGLLQYLRWRDGNRLTIFNYHRIRPDGDFSSRFNEGVYGPTASDFRQQVSWLKRHTRVLGEDELLAIMKSGEAPSEPCSLITFDDGYRDNYTLAYPILRDLGARAMFFI